MKRIIALFLSIVILLTGCGQAQSTKTGKGDTESEITDTSDGAIVWDDGELQFNSLDDEQLLVHIEDLVYRETVTSLNS